MYRWIYSVLCMKFIFFPGLDPSVICAKLKRLDKLQVDLSSVVNKVNFFSWSRPFYNLQLTPYFWIWILPFSSVKMPKNTQVFLFFAYYNW
jgi:hypothetical protein